ncbi:unnamed protein product, partial [Meganyctiphanes norvegica]
MKGVTLLVVAAVATIATGDHGGVHDHKQRMVCYLGSWAVYRPGMGKFSIEDIDATLCNNLVYSFVGLDEATFKVKSLDPEYDINKKAFERFVGLKKQNPDLEITVAIGGWTEGSKKYSAMAANPALRRGFIDSIVMFIKEHNFDGLDLDWEYPANRGGVPEDKENFVTLVKELRQEFDKHDWLLTAALGAGKSTIESAYNVKELARYVDYIHVMAYDYHGKWDGKTGHNAPLYPRDDETEAEKTLNVEYTINYYLQLGCPPEKLVMGLGLYGRTFLLQDKANQQFGSASQPTAFAGPYTREDGFLGYNEICEKQKTEAGLWKVVWQKAHQAPYMFMENMWVSYDDDNSLHLKTAFAQKKGLAGVMVWSIDTDDFKGTCFNQKFPLLRAINKALADKKDQRPAQAGPGSGPAHPPVHPPVHPPHKPGLDDHDHDHD